MSIYLEKGTPPSPTLGSFQHLLTRRHRVVVLACCLLFAITSIYTIFAFGIVDSELGRVAPTELRPVKLNKGDGGRVRSLIPQKIWQIMLPKGGKTVDMYNVDPEQLKETNTWLAKNIDYQYQLLGPRRADEFVAANFASNQRLMNAYHNLTNMGMKSDLLRYLLLSVEGGVYSDIDTVAIRPVDAWIPRHLRDRIRLVVGIEFDKLDGPNWADIPHDLQFCQWTIAAAPGHPVFTRMVDRILDSLDELSEQHGVPVSEIVPGSFEVMNSTGPAAWTDAVFETLQTIDPSLNETKDLSFMKEARVFGDILVLTIDGFGMGQIHSDSTNDGTIPKEALIKHQFWGSWREPNPEDDEKKEEEAQQDDTTGGDQSEQQQQDQQPTEEEPQLTDESLRMQEAQRLQEEAEKLRVGAEKLAEAAQKQKEEAMKTIGEPEQHEHDESEHHHDHTEHQHDQSEHHHDESDHHHEQPPAPAQITPPASPSPAAEAHEEEHAKHEEDEDYFRSDEVLAVDTSPPPAAAAAPGSKQDEDDFDPEETLLVDTGSPPWPGQEWAP